MKTVTFLIPVYNEEKRIGKAFSALNAFVMPKNLKLAEVIFVNDGSNDKTISKVKAYQKNGKFSKITKLVSYETNMGKGYAIRAGMKEASSDYTLFFDADISTPLSEINKFVPFIKEGIDVIVGTRKNGHSTVIKHQPKLREFLGRGFTKMTQIALGVNVTDFTCGFKAFSRRAKNRIFSETVINGWGYDAEIIFLAIKFNFSLVEKAVTWSNDDRTKVKLYKAVPQTMKELAIINLEHNIKPLANSFGKSLAINYKQSFVSRLISLFL